MQVKTLSCLKEWSMQATERTEEDILSLVQSYQKNPKKTALIHELVQQFMGQILTIASHCIKRNHLALLEMDDLIEPGIKGLLDALFSYDPGYGTQVKTWTHTRILGKMQNYIRKCRFTVHQPRTNGESYPTYALTGKLAILTSHEDEEKWGASGVIDALFADINWELPFKEFEYRHDLSRILPTLRENEYEVIRLYYWEDLTFQEIKNCLGVSMTTVNFRMQQARKKLKKRIMKKVI